MRLSSTAGSVEHTPRKGKTTRLMWKHISNSHTHTHTLFNYAYPGWADRPCEHLPHSNMIFGTNVVNILQSSFS